jgi:hypothetical protein
MIHIMVVRESNVSPVQPMSNQGRNHADCERLIRQRGTETLRVRRPC